MRKQFGGRVLALQRDDINTDELIPARYLTEIERKNLRSHLLEDLSLDGFDHSRDIANRQVVISGGNFGCGSSREHAPWALEENGITVVIAKSFARIFRQNMFNCGMLAIECDDATLNKIFALEGQLTAQVDLDGSTFTVAGTGGSVTGEFDIKPFDRTLIEEGGWIEYASKKY